MQATKGYGEKCRVMYFPGSLRWDQGSFLRPKVTEGHVGLLRANNVLEHYG